MAGALLGLLSCSAINLASTEAEVKVGAIYNLWNIPSFNMSFTIHVSVGIFKICMSLLLELYTLWHI